MMKILALALALCSVTAFVPTNVQRTRVAPAMAEASPSVPFLNSPKYYPTEWAGDVGFDPLGLSEFFDIKFLREAEIKHGRVCMLACLGYIFPEVFFHIPGDAYTADNPLVAVAQVGPQPLLQIIIFGGFVEAGLYNGKMTALTMFEGEQKDREPGDFGFDPLKLMEDGDPNQYALKEITHGRLAMVAIGGMIQQSLITDAGLFGHV
eukprot:CAMPEP_0185743604 /NCGR_PEP_ID=MMETSP1174-20130828/1393_1 /TAXON_ID=35687 /ORGANISM="Dictyocha speculum, Strain CCMP1381" /LENGTH=206 /DNA_ID=CAMNT_0028416421 /DNA_START=31 /DNA_END=651 /DNA_ORIENTATION=-